LAVLADLRQIRHIGITGDVENSRLGFEIFDIVGSATWRTE